jgi:3'-phosphoadenosine 5'-phosphosulfate sulfotransferase (PAPS reductase)/FAD synthetase
MDVVCKMAEEQGVLDRVEAIHADLGADIEWPGTKDLAFEHAIHYGIPFRVVKREQEEDLLEHFKKRYYQLQAMAKAIESAIENKPAWPELVAKLHYKNLQAYKKVLRKAKGGELTYEQLSEMVQQLRDTPPWASPTNRYCTSDWKRGPCNKVITAQHKRWSNSHDEHFYVLNVYGFRAEESAARAKRPTISYNVRASTKSRTVIDYLPIHGYTTEQVWETIHASGARHHWAYDRGMSRLSCRFCIFAPKSQLMVAMLQPENQEVKQRYLDFEKECGFSFQHKLSLADVQQAIDAGERPTHDDGEWNM